VIVYKVYKATLWFQGVYTLLTAFWAIIDIDSFMAITGPKTDIWLVKTVSVILLAIGAGFIVQALVPSTPLPILIVALSSSTGLCFVDIYYTTNDVISAIYLGDAVLQVLFIAIWIYVLFNLKRLAILISSRHAQTPTGKE
jgi:hypothetical protein